MIIIGISVPKNIPYQLTCEVQREAAIQLLLQPHQRISDFGGRYVSVSSLGIQVTEADS